MPIGLSQKYSITVIYTIHFNNVRKSIAREINLYSRIILGLFKGTSSVIWAGRPKSLNYRLGLKQVRNNR